MERLQLHSQAISQGQTAYDYIIVGAGISGVQAADILASKKNTSFLVLEAQPAIGGRIGSIAVSGLEEVKKADWVKKNIDKINSVIVEKGATWIEQRHLVLLQLCKQFGITLREQHVHGQGTYLAKEKPYTSSELMKHPEYAETIKLIIEVIDELSVQYNKVVYSDLKVTSPQAKQMLKKYDRMTLTQFLNERIPERLKFVREIFDSFFEHTECYKSADNSMHEVLTKNARSNDLAILKELLGDFGHEPSYLLNGGTSVLITSFIKEIQKKLKKPISDVLKLSHQVITVDNRSKNHTTIICQLPGNVIKKYRCKHVICAVPLTVTRSIAFENISKAKRLIIDNQLISNSKKNFMITKTPFWRRDSNGKPAANGQGLFSNDYLVNFCHDISPPDESCGIMVYFHHGKKLDAWEATYSDQDYEKKRNYFIELMSKIYKVKPEDKARLFDGCIYHDCSYMNDQFIKSGFQSLTRPGTFNQVLEMGDSLEALYRDENGITFVGSEYSLQFASYMQGAVRITRQKVFKLIGEKDPLAHLLVENNLPTQ